MICGFVMTGPSHDSDLQDARELWAIYVDPQRWGMGIGRLLMAAAGIGSIKTVRARPCFGSSQETLAPGAFICSTDGTATGLGSRK
jgi:GNAT superfamily N-acetyltransferase